MQPTSDDFSPRRDGWYEHKGTWGEVTVGTVIADSNSRTKRWEIIDTSHGPDPIPTMKTLWMRAREQTTGEEFTSPPRTKTAKVIILTQDPADTTTPDYTPPSDTEAVWALVEGLGATLMASIDAETGEVTCPDYIDNSHLLYDEFRPVYRGLIQHMMVAHQHTVDHKIDLAEAITMHGKLHNDPETPNPGGFSHRHEGDYTHMITGKRQ